MVFRVDLRIASSLGFLVPLLALAAEDVVALNALVAELEARLFDQVEAHAGALPRSVERDNVRVTAVALRSGADAALSFATSVVPDPGERAGVLAGATMRCVRMREYEAARRLMEAVMTREPGLKSQERLALVASAMFTGLRRHEELRISRSDPRHPAVRLLEIGSGVSSDRQNLFAVEFGSLPESVLGRSLRAPTSSPEMGLREFVLPPDVVLDIALALTDFNITGDSSLGWRVRLSGLFSPGGLDHFVVLQGDEARLLGLAGGMMPPVLWGLGRRAAALVEAGNLAEARQWIVWARESLGETRDTAWARFFVSSTPEVLATAEGIRTAADALASTGSLRRLAGVGPAVGAAAAIPVVPSAVLSPGLLPFSDRMTRPVLQSSPNGRRFPEYPEEARASGVSGLVIVRCTMTEQGKAEECTIVKPLVPLLDREVLDWLAGSTWSPITLDGKPQRVSYVFNFSFQLQQPLPSRRAPTGQ